MTTIVPIDHVKKFCKLGTIFCCRYLVGRKDSFECAKGLPEIKILLDQRVKNGTIRAVGDNCDGIEKIKSEGSTEQSSQDENLIAIARSILANGPRRVLVDDNYAVGASQAQEMFDVTPDVIFIRDDGWSLGAPEHLAYQAETLWTDKWIGVLLRGKTEPFTMAEYSKFREVVS